MKIKAEAINGAIEKIGILAAQDKNPPGVLLDIGESTVELFYSTNSKAIACVIDAKIGAEEFHGKAIFDYKRFVDIIRQSASSSGIIKVSDLDIMLNKNPNNTGTAVVTSAKFIDRVTEGGESYQKKVSDNSYDLSWWEVSQASVKQKVLGAPPCDMFPEDEGSAITMGTKEYCRLFDSVTSGDASVVYLSQNIVGAFASNTNSIVFARAESVNSIGKTVQFGTPTAKAISSILKKIDNEELKLATLQSDDKDVACLFYNDNRTFSLYMSLVAERKVDISRTNSFRNIKYGTYQMTFINAVMTDILKSAYNITPAANIKISIVKDESPENNSGVAAKILAVDSGASVLNTYQAVCETFNTVLEPVENGVYTEFETNLKNLLDVVNSCKDAYLGFDLEIASNGNYLRVGFFSVDRCIEETNKMKESTKSELGEALAKANEARDKAKKATADKEELQTKLDNAKAVLDGAKNVLARLNSKRETLALESAEVSQIVGAPESALGSVNEHTAELAKNIAELDVELVAATEGVDSAIREVDRLAGEFEVAGINEAEALERYSSAYKEHENKSEMSVDAKIELRESYVDTCYYLPLKKS